ncbi:MAG: patatin-like phospholipase family protein [Pseudonocardia sp.]
MTDPSPPGPRRVAIACQGGGSHTAFTAGVLSRLLDGDELGTSGEYAIAGISGTSGGAVCALLTWTALREGDRHRARTLLEGFWADNSASSPLDSAANLWLLWASTMQSVGLLPAVSPYHLPVDGLDQFRDLLTHWVDFERIEADTAAEHPQLVIGAVDVLSGRFRAFDSRAEKITPDMILASAAIPTVFRTVHTDGGAYWDGLFSQNPPVHELLRTKPDELWVIQINPTARADEPRTVLDITDRRNELAGNLSLYQELHGIEVIDRLLAEGKLVGVDYKQVTVRVLEFARPRSSRLMGPASKLNRDARFMRELAEQGEQQAVEFLAMLAFERAWRARDVERVRAIMAPDVVLTSTTPFRPRAGLRGAAAHEEIAELCRTARMDLTRKQLTRERATWTVRLDGPDPGDGAGGRGRIEAEITDQRVTHLRLGPAPAWPRPSSHPR